MTMTGIRPAVNELTAAGLNPCPPKRDGSKQPAGAWKRWQTERVPPAQLDAWYGDAPGVGIFCGAISGNLECLEFDDWQTWEAYRDTAEANGLTIVATIAAGWSDATPGDGVHLYYRCEEIAGNKKLASRPPAVAGGKVATLIETRGEGGFVIVAPSGGPTHPTGNPYTRLAGGPATVATATPEQRAAMLDLARVFDEMPAKRTFTAPQGKPGKGTRPGDDLNAKADETWWRERTEADGWTWTAGPGAMWYLARPGNPAGWTGATWNWDSRGHLRVHTTSTQLEPGMYDAFGYVAHWDHGGDWKAAAKALAAAGYGERAAPFSFSGEGNAGEGDEDAGDLDAMRLAPNLAFGKGRYWSLTQHAGDDPGYTQLNNFDARITDHRIISDGLTTRREYSIAGSVAGVPFTPVTTPADKFRSLDWVSEIGPHAIVAAGASVPGKLRQAIQERSVKLGIAETHVYAHSGWIERAGEHVYLSTSGGIGPAGLRSDLTVELPGKLAHLDLPAPPERAQLRRDAAAWLALWQLAPERIMAPLLAAVPRAILAPFLTVETAIQLEGRTGTRKSELTARAQQFFGLRFDRLTLPQSWGSTKNSIMLTAHQAKDAVCVVDDHVVDGSRNEQEKQRAAMNAVFSAVGNHTDRGRLDGNMQQRAEYVPRGLILSSGEDQSYRQSATARTLLIEVRAGDVRLDVLTQAQAAGEDGAFARLTAGFVQTVARQWEATGHGYRERYRHYQARYRDTLNAHARTPDSAASLMAALECWLDFLERAGGIDQPTKVDLLRRAGRGFLELGMAQAAALQSVDPVTQFVELVRSAIASGAAHVADAKDGTVPPNPIPCGYRLKLIRTSETLEPDYQPQGACIAWIDERGVFLDPNAALAAAQTIGAKTGQSIPWQSKTLGKRLAERGMLASSETGKNNIRLNLAGARRTVWHLPRETILPPESDDPENVRTFAGGNGQEVA